MKFHVLTLFPEMVMQGLAPSIIGRAVEKKLISLEAVNIRDYTLDKHGKVDDYTYGGGAGMECCDAGETGAHGLFDTAGRSLYPENGEGAVSGGGTGLSLRTL